MGLVGAVLEEAAEGLGWRSQTRKLKWEVAAAEAVAAAIAAAVAVAVAAAAAAAPAC